MIITIDGPSGTGKSTVAKGVARRLNFTFFDTGAMYRAMAWFLLERKVSPDEHNRVCSLLSEFDFKIKTESQGGRRYFVNGTEVTDVIRTQQISTLASQVAVISEVRKAMVKIQRDFGRSSDAVFEGRDMGTVVFPDADLKIFLTAKPEVRAERRYRELLGKFPDLAESFSLEQIHKDIVERDHNDSTRAISPLKQAQDAILIDTSNLSADQVIEKIVELQRKRAKHRKYPRMKFAYWIVLSAARWFFKLFFRLKIYGTEHFRPGAGIIAANHASFYDPEVVSISCPEEVHFLAKESLFKIPLFGRFIRTLNAHPVSRDASDAATFRLIIQLLQHGKKVILFPEGRRSPDGEIHELEKGLPFLVQKAKCKIFPVYVAGTFEAWPINRSLPKIWGRISCVFGTPIEWESFEGLDKKEAMAKINERTERSLRALKSWFEAGAKGTPP
ncbi:MAG: (d)CMP kinase [Verrucomicrobia bacterium]|nr:(d)CMP kinase [Verrucomicrobiota bacterium]